MRKLSTVLFFAFLSCSLFAQTNKMKEQSSKLVEKMNMEIMSINPALGLSDAQKVEIGKLITERSIAFGDATKNEKDVEKRKEAQKEVVKPFNKKIFGEVLSKEQKIALDTARNKVPDSK